MLYRARSCRSHILPVSVLRSYGRQRTQNWVSRGDARSGSVQSCSSQSHHSSRPNGKARRILKNDLVVEHNRGLRVQTMRSFRDK